MSSKILTIAIPTYNRPEQLSETLQRLVPQLEAGVEIVVLDNCSTYDSTQIKGMFDGHIRWLRHAENIGSDRNFLSCLTQAEGKYCWILCDDDWPCVNAVAEIKRVIRQDEDLGLIYLRACASDESISNYTDQPVQIEWQHRNRDQFLEDIGVWVTFGSSVVVNRRSLDMHFIESNIGTNLLPSSIPLTAAGISNRVAISNHPLVYARGGNAGGYDAFVVFTRNFHRLLKKCLRFGYGRSSVRAAFNSSLVQMVPHLLKVWPLTIRGTLSVVRYGLPYWTFYKRILPALCWRVGVEFRRWWRSE